jgi:hypothetical protein
MESFFSAVAMMAITLPVSFLVAHGCLRGILRFVTGDRHPLCYDSSRERSARGVGRFSVPDSSELLRRR